VESLVDIPPQHGLIAVAKGSVYLVEKLPEREGDCASCGKTSVGILLLGDRPEPEWAWCPCVFRPYRGPEQEKRQAGKKIGQPA